MSKDLEERVDRLERAYQQGLNLSLAEFDSADQARARDKQAEADEKAAEKAAEKAEEA